LLGQRREHILLQSEGLSKKKPKKKKGGGGGMLLPHPLFKKGSRKPRKLAGTSSLPEREMAEVLHDKNGKRGKERALRRA